LNFAKKQTDMGHIDISRLFVQWIIVVAITGGLLLAFQEKKNSKA
jgi:hypothetical protein